MGNHYFCWEHIGKSDTKMRDFPQEVEGYSVPCLTVWPMPFTLNQEGDTTTRIHGRKLWAMQRHQRKRNRKNKHKTWNHWEFAQNYDQIISLLGLGLVYVYACTKTVPACATAPDHQSSANSWWYDFRLIGAGNPTIAWIHVPIQKGHAVVWCFYRMTLDAVSWHFDFPLLTFRLSLLVNLWPDASGHGTHVMTGRLAAFLRLVPFVANKRRTWNFITLWMFFLQNMGFTCPTCSSGPAQGQRDHNPTGTRRLRPAKDHVRRISLKLFEHQLQDTNPKALVLQIPSENACRPQPPIPNTVSEWSDF